MPINENIKKYLEEHGIKQTFLANKSGIHIKKINSIIANNRKVSAEELGKISKALDVDPNIFLD